MEGQDDQISKTAIRPHRPASKLGGTVTTAAAVDAAAPSPVVSQHSAPESAVSDVGRNIWPRGPLRQQHLLTYLLDIYLRVSVGRSEVLMSLRHYLLAQSQGHHTIDRL